MKNDEKVNTYEIIKKYHLESCQDTIELLEHLDYYIVSSFVGISIFCGLLLDSVPLLTNLFCSFFFNCASYCLFLFLSKYQYKNYLERKLNLNINSTKFVCSCIKQKNNKYYIYVNKNKIAEVNSQKINSNTVFKINKNLTIFDLNILN